jgi:Tol biopolymer transport system component
MAITASVRCAKPCTRLACALLVLWLYGQPAAAAAGGPPGDFEGKTDVGNVELPGSVEIDAAKGEYRITGSGANIWGDTDAFHFAWWKVAGDLEMTAEVNWVGAGKQAHRKAGWMVRQDLTADSPYADAVVHGDGLISLQYRRTRGGPTMEVKAPVKPPALIRLERTGDLFSLSVAPKGESFEPVGSLTVTMPRAVHAGLVVCSHDAATRETAIFTNVARKTFDSEAAAARLRESSLETIEIETGRRKLIYRARHHFEAPNWSPDGRRFVFNQEGLLYTLPTGGGTPSRLDTGVADRCNNDHGYSPDGNWLAISHSKRGQSIVSVLPSSGGAPRQVTPDGPSYWHGWSPDGRTLAYCAERDGEFDVYAIPAAGGNESRLTTAPGLDDGPDYTPDGKQIYFNSVRSGLMKLWRMNADGSQQEQVTTDTDYADWFPHPSPDGRWLVFLSYDKTVSGHPEDKDVVLRMMPLSGGTPRVLATLFGGQGTINVPSWSPDGKHVAFVSYRLVLP